MGRFVEGADRSQGSFLPDCLGDWVDENNPVQVIDAFVEALDLPALGFDGARPANTGRPAYHPGVLLKLYIYGYLNRVQSSRRLEREAGRNVELMWLLGRLVPDHKTIADFRKDYGGALRRVCTRFVALCHQMGLLASTTVVVDGSKFKAVNNRDRNFTYAKMAPRVAQIEESIARYLHQLDSADRQEPSEAIATKVARLKEKIGRLRRGDGGPWEGSYFTGMEGSLRTPAIIRYPGHVPAGQVSNEIVHITDMFMVHGGCWIDGGRADYNYYFVGR